MFKSLAEAWADTATPYGELMITILGGLATFERHLILARTGEGRKRAKAAGVHMGWPHKLDTFQRREAIARREAGESLSDIARTLWCGTHDDRAAVAARSHHPAQQTGRPPGGRFLSGRQPP